jgi:DNA-binding MurR/RpiR family transcriptional regulator
MLEETQMIFFYSLGEGNAITRDLEFRCNKIFLIVSLHENQNLLQGKTNNTSQVKEQKQE